MDEWMNVWEGVYERPPRRQAEEATLQLYKFWHSSWDSETRVLF
jgi:hypothetical protein